MAEDNEASNPYDMGLIVNDGFRKKFAEKPRKAPGGTVADRQLGERKARKPNDGRRLKRSVRTEPINMRVTVDFRLEVLIIVVLDVSSEWMLRRAERVISSSCRGNTGARRTTSPRVHRSAGRSPP